VVTFTGTTGAANDSVASNNIVTTPATMLDAVNDTASAAGGLTGQSTNLASNDQYPANSSFSLVSAGTTCAAPTVSATGTAGYTVPASGSCLINYQVCAAAPNATTCDNATLTVTAQSADMSAAFTNVPTVVRPGQSLTGLSLTCTNSATAAAAATNATCAPTASVGTISAVTCTPAVGGNVAAGAAIVCSFNYTAPGTQGGADETTTCGDLHRHDRSGQRQRGEQQHRDHTGHDARRGQRHSQRSGRPDGPEHQPGEQRPDTRAARPSRWSPQEPPAQPRPSAEPARPATPCRPAAAA
jgi:hypothetical protein